MRIDLLLRLQVLLLVALGAYLRISQFNTQVLLDDEWHAVHQLLSGKTPQELFLTLGWSDYSVPLGIFYYWLSHNTGLTEFSMRLPMLSASLISLLAFVAYVWRRFPPTTTLVFTLFLATSPLLTIYAHTARPYAITLLLSYAALFFFYQYWQSPKDRWASGVGYVACAGLCLWLHLITGPFLVAPFLLEAARALRERNWSAFPRLIYLGLPAAMLMAGLVLPALLHDFHSLAIKSGGGKIAWDTALGVWHIWLGSSSVATVFVLVCLAVLGLPHILRHNSLLQSACLGAVLTLAFILGSQPNWVQHPVTMGRYLLTAIPLLALASACGTTALITRSASVVALRAAILAAASALLIASTISNPVWPLVFRPNNQMTHSLYQFDFRAGHNRVEDYQRQHLPVSAFWTQLAAAPSDSLRIAVAPFYFETYNWAAPDWERSSRQRILPAYLTGYCVPERFGEVPRNSLYRFSNAFYLDQLNSSDKAQPDWLVYTRPFTGYADGVDGRLVGEESEHCFEKLREQLGIPDYQDESLLAWKLGGERQ